MDPLNLIWLFFIFSALQPAVQRQMLARSRRQTLSQIARDRDATVITLIHRQETISLLGIPLMRHIDIDDAESVLKAIRGTEPGKTIEIILHTPGGLVLAASQIARALRDHDGHVVAVVPHYAMSGGTLIALAAHEIVMDANAVLGPVDPQIGSLPAASLVRAADLKGARSEDQLLVLADIARKSRAQVGAFVARLLEKHMPAARAQKLATTLSEGRWTHDYGITADAARGFGLNVSTAMPRTVYELMDLYPQGAGRRPSVLYTPVRMPPDMGLPAAPPPQKVP